VAERKVTVGIRDGQRAEILAGVEPGETVAVSGAGFLTDGALVAQRTPDEVGTKAGTPPDAGGGPP
jgi:multidrug efflux pump subunit AcrA (membrane-fusion protein)